MSGRGYRKSPSFLIPITERRSADTSASHNSNRSPAKRVRFEKEEGDRIVQFSPQGGNGTVRASDVVHCVEKHAVIFSCFVKTSEI